MLDIKKGDNKMEKIKTNFGKIISILGLAASVLLGMYLFLMFDMRRIDAVELIVILLTLASSVLLVVYGFMNKKLKILLLVASGLFLGSLLIEDLNNIIAEPLWIFGFSLLFTLAMITFYVLYVVDGREIFKNVLIGLLLALTLSHLVSFFRGAVSSGGYLLISILFMLYLLTNKKANE